MQPEEPQTNLNPARQRELASLPASPYRFPQGHRAWGHPEDGPVQISLSPSAYQEVMSHATSRPHPVAGLLLGYVFRSPGGDRYHVAVEKALSGPEQSEEVPLLDEDHRQALLAERDRHFPQYLVIGWYHSQPGANIATQAGNLPRPEWIDKAWQVELVVDPTQNEGYFFATGDDGQVTMLPGYYERIHPGFGWANWGRPAGLRQASVAPLPATGAGRNYTLPLVLLALALLTLCSLAFVFLNWQKTVGERNRAEEDLYDTRYQLEQYMQTLGITPSAMVTPGTPSPATVLPSATLGASASPFTPGGTRTLTATPTVTGAPTLAGTVGTPQPSPTTGSGYPVEGGPTAELPTPGYP